MGAVGLQKECVRELEGDAAAGQVFVRVITIGPLRIEHGVGARQTFFGQMVVGDDDVESE